MFFEDASQRLGYYRSAWILERGKYFFITLVPIWILFIARSLAKDGKNLGKLSYLVLIDPIVTQFGLWTNNKFHLYYSSFSVMNWSIGLLSAIHIIIFFTIISVSIFYLCFFLKKSEKEMQPQAIILIIFTALPALVNIAFIAKSEITPYATPVFFALSTYVFRTSSSV